MLTESQWFFAEFADQFLPVVRVDPFQFLRDPLRVQPLSQALQMDELHGPRTFTGRDERVYLVLHVVQTDSTCFARL